MFYMPAPDRNSRSPDHRIASDRATSQRALKEAGGPGRIDPGCGRRLPKIDDARPDPEPIRPPPAPEPLFTRISAEIQMSNLCQICVKFGFVKFGLHVFYLTT